MLITTAHLLALNELGTSEAAGHAARALTEDDPQEHIYRVLELQGLVLFEPPRSYRLAYAGQEALLLLQAMREAALLPPLAACRRERTGSHASRSASAYVVHGTGTSARTACGRRQNRVSDGDRTNWKVAPIPTLRPG